MCRFSLSRWAKMKVIWPLLSNEPSDFATADSRALFSQHIKAAPLAQRGDSVNNLLMAYLLIASGSLVNPFVLHNMVKKRTVTTVIIEFICSPRRFAARFTGENHFLWYPQCPQEGSIYLSFASTGVQVQRCRLAWVKKWRAKKKPTQKQIKSFAAIVSTTNLAAVA